MIYSASYDADCSAGPGHRSWSFKEAIPTQPWPPCPSRPATTRTISSSAVVSTQAVMAGWPPELAAAQALALAVCAVTQGPTE